MTIKSLPWTGDEDADRLLAESPLALMLGMLLDQQVKMEWAFRAPHVLQERLGAPLDASARTSSNRPNRSKSDRMLKARLSLNGHEVTRIEDFGHYEIGVVILANEIDLTELRIEILEGTHNPGLYAVEVYR